MCQIVANFGTKKFGGLVYLFLYLLTYSLVGMGGELGGGGATLVESLILADRVTMHNWMT
jgi:hypothetical protein